MLQKVASGHVPPDASCFHPVGAFSQCNAMQCSASSFAAATAAAAAAAAAAETYLYSTSTRTQAIEKHVYLSEQAYVM